MSVWQKKIHTEVSVLKKDAERGAEKKKNTKLSGEGRKIVS